MLIPAYNRAGMLPRAIASAWSQLPARPAEVIVVDDGSEDETAAVAAEMGATVLRHPSNLGLSAARNTGLRAARQSWIALLDSDDEWLPHHLQSVWGLRGGHVMVAGAAVSRGPDPSEDCFIGPLTKSPLVVKSGIQLVYPGNFVPVSATMFQRDLALDVGGFRPHNGLSEDYDMWLRLAERGTAACSPRVSVIYHVHSGQMSAQDVRALQLAGAGAAAEHLERMHASRVPLERAEGVTAWDNLRRAVRGRRYREAMRWSAFAARKPQRALGLLGFLVRRVHIAHRNAALRRAGVLR